MDINLDGSSEFPSHKRKLRLQISQILKTRSLVKLMKSVVNVVSGFIVDQSENSNDEPRRKHTFHLFHLISVVFSVNFELTFLNSIIDIFYCFVILNQSHQNREVFFFGEFYCFVYNQPTQKQIECSLTLSAVGHLVCEFRNSAQDTL